ncbi:hypothetical protein FNV43_RR16822 [Rhamnella rubrinervis]|uniref:Ribosome-associated protein quality control protein P2 RNA-binding domain-containing protein n=1 Tax=Rhamnella rubrinervis TaxID=2594499 RepID=A0A8K0GZH4_9ROSA|nr:hypothetical protein FNV43_RR16822 [Rhamnella rubrinervis]
MAAKTFIGIPTLVRSVARTFVLSHPLHINNRLSYHATLGYFPLTSPSSSGICHLAQAIKGDVDVLLKGVGDKNTIEEVKRILEMARRASSRREILHTNFLTPPVLKESMLALEKLADVKAVAQGGYPQAERCRISVGRPEVFTNDPDIVAALSITGNFSYEPCYHGDFLGAILGTGISREKLGDIILQGEKGAQVIIVPELIDFFISSLDKVGNVGVSCQRIPLIALDYEPPRTKSFKTIEASLRVDALASAGFKISRSKLVDLIRPESTDFLIYLSMQIGEIKSTKKGKYAVELIRYLQKLYQNRPSVSQNFNVNLRKLYCTVCIGNSVGANCIATELTMRALLPTFTTVVDIPQNVLALLFAAMNKVVDTLIWDQCAPFFTTMLDKNRPFLGLKYGLSGGVNYVIFMVIIFYSKRESVLKCDVKGTARERMRTRLRKLVISPINKITKKELLALYFPQQ